MTAAPGACFYRIRLPLEALAANGWDVTFASVADARDDSLRDPGGGYAGVTMTRKAVTAELMRGYDIAIGQRLCKYDGLDAWRRARWPFSRLVYEIDDDVFAVGAENWKAYHLFGTPSVRDAIVHAVEVADLVTVTTPALARVFGEFNGNVAILPNCVPDWVPETVREPYERPAAGWVGGASHGNDVGLIAAPVRRFLKRFPGWDFICGGTDYRPTFRHERVKFEPWKPVNADPQAYFSSIRMDIGLAPLAGCRFAESKSFIKVLEYAARGIPSVASPAGPYPNFIRHGENGFLARTDHEWLKYLSELAADPGLREKMGARAREDARNWTIGSRWREWAEAYEGLFKA